MPFFNTFGTFAPFSLRTQVNPIILTASYGLTTQSSIQIKNITGVFTSINVIRYDKTNSLVTTFQVSPFLLGMTFTDATVTSNISYAYVIQPLSGGSIGKKFIIPGTVNALVNNFNTIDNTGMVMYYTFETPQIYDRPPNTVSVQAQGLNTIIDSSAMVVYYPMDYMY